MTDAYSHAEQTPGADPFAAPGGGHRPDPGTPATPAHAAPPAAPAAGWYPDPHNPSQQRYWDGATWTASQSPGPAPARRRRLSRGAIAAIVVGAVVILGGGATAAAVLLPRLGDATASLAADAAGGRALDAPVPANWSTLPVMDGAATVGYDPEWEEISDYMGADLLESTMQQQGGVDVRIDGAWLTAGDLWTGGTSVIVMSVADAGGPSTPQFEAQSYMFGTRTQFEEVLTVSEGPVQTSTGLNGYVIEYETALYDQMLPGSVGILVDGRRQLLVVTSGLETTGSGVESMEAILESLTYE